MLGKSLEPTCGYRGRAVLAMNRVLAGAGRAPCLAAQLSRQVPAERRSWIPHNN